MPPGTAYVALDRHTFGDMAPYVYVTTDFGKTWSPLATPKESKGIRGYVHVIKEDTVDPHLLFMGTEFGLWISTDAGAHWAQFKGGHIPTVAVRDLAIQPRDNDLVLATHGRGIWIVDDITPLRHLTAELLSTGGGLRVCAAGATTHRSAGRLADGRGLIHRRQPRQRCRHHLLPEEPPSVRQAEDRDTGLPRAMSLMSCPAAHGAA